MLHLEKEFDLVKHIRPVCFPQDDKALEGLSDTECFAAGWGKDPTSELSSYRGLLNKPTKEFNI